MKTPIATYSLLAALLLSSFLVSTSAFAQTAQPLIPFQGRLTNQQGTAYTGGQYSITFNLYSVAVGGSTVWTERHEKVGVVNGMVNVFLGSINTIGSVDFSTTKYLGVTVDVDNNAATADPEMVPRQMIIPAFWAKQADNSTKMAGKDWTTIIVDGSNNASNDPSTGFLKGSKVSPGSIGTAQLASGLTLGGVTTVNTISLNTISLPATTASSGIISLNGSTFLHAYGSGNTFVGPAAGNLSTTGATNTGIGQGVLTVNTSGSGNTAEGYAALNFNSTGSNNTAVGTSAMRSNTTGDGNTATGFQALFSNTIASANTANGYAALSANISGVANTAVGYQALGTAVYSHNTAIGAFALLSNTTGGENTASGRDALRLNTTGSQNMAAGSGTLQFNTTGSRNIAVGYGAGGALTVGSDNISIGNNGVAGESNTIRIGTAGTHTNTYLAGIVHGNGLVPPGTIVAFAGVTPPTGWVLCDGASYLRTDPVYANLFAVIGTLYGAPDATHFRVPDYRGRFLRGVDAGAGNDPDANGTSRLPMNSGANTFSNNNGLGTVQTDDFKSHMHLYANVGDAGVGAGRTVATGFFGNNYGIANQGVTAAGGNETRPKNVYVNYVLKY